MICRLCLNNIGSENAVLLFTAQQDSGDDSDDVFQETQLVKMIANYLYLELAEDDAISTYICNECRTHLENFHSFWQVIEQKQNTLADKSLEINCDVNWADDEQDPTDQLMESKVELKVFEAPNVVLNCKTQYEINIKNEPEMVEEPNELFESTAEAVVHVKHETRKRTLLSEQQDDPVAELGDNDEAVNEDLLEVSLSKRPTKLQIHKTNEEIVANYMHLSCAACNGLKNQNDRQQPATAYKTFTDLRQHFQAVHKTAPYVKCCDVVFSRLARLVEHVRWHQNPEEFTCQFCQKVLRSKINLHNHIKATHNHENELVDTKQTQGTTTYTCSTCGQHFTCHETFKQHALEHQTVFEPVECSDCGRLYVNTDSLHHHMQYAHKKEKKFSCEYCAKSFKLKRYLQEHIATHTREKLHSCPHCPTEFRCKSNMYAHIKRKHHKEWRRAKELKLKKQDQIEHRHTA